MKSLLSAIFAVLMVSASAQFEIGHLTHTFNDPLRAGGFGSGGGPGHQIQTEIYYPALAEGESTLPASGSFPVVVFGHGFVMEWDAYANIREALVEAGYIVAFPRTEGGITPSHQDFGLDIALLAGGMQALGADPGSLLHTHVHTKTAIGGHSMGGGAALLAAGELSGQTTDGSLVYFGMASAETSPSAIASAAAVNIPALMFSATGDGVTPPADHQIPMYEALGADCRYHISITGGGHCFFANENLACDFGELVSAGDITITRDEQHDILFDYLIPWFDFFLSGIPNYFESFEIPLLADSRVTYAFTCSGATGIAGYSSPEISVYPNPASNFLTVSGIVGPWAFKVLDSPGSEVRAGFLSANAGRIDVSALKAGLYVILFISPSGALHSGRFVKQ